LKNTLEKVLKLEVVEFEWNTNLDPQFYNHLKDRDRLKSIGLIAQDVRQYYPEIVHTDERGYYTVDYNKLNAVLVESIKEQQLIIEDIENKIKYLQTKLK